MRTLFFSSFVIFATPRMSLAALEHRPIPLYRVTAGANRTSITRTQWLVTVVTLTRGAGKSTQICSRSEQVL